MFKILTVALFYQSDLQDEEAPKIAADLYTLDEILMSVETDYEFR